MFWGTLLGGLGVLLVNTQATMMMPLSVELRLGAVTAFEVAKAALTFVVVLVLVALGSSLLAASSARRSRSGVVVIALTPLAVPMRPRARARASTGRSPAGSSARRCRSRSP